MRGHDVPVMVLEDANRLQQVQSARLAHPYSLFTRLTLLSRYRLPIATRCVDSILHVCAIAIPSSSAIAYSSILYPVASVVAPLIAVLAVLTI